MHKCCYPLRYRSWRAINVSSRNRTFSDGEMGESSEILDSSVTKLFAQLIPWHMTYVIVSVPLPHPLLYVSLCLFDLQNAEAKESVEPCPFCYTPSTTTTTTPKRLLSCGIVSYKKNERMMYFDVPSVQFSCYCVVHSCY